MNGSPVPTRPARRILRRGPCENASTVVIAVGVFFLVQPFSLALYSWSFAIVLAGTLAFVITSHFPE